MTSKGFGSRRQDPRNQKAPSKSASQRQAAAQQLDDYKKQGLPLFNVYVRLPEKPQNWIPVGEIAVKRSSQISQAIFANEAELLKGALRLYPKLSKVKDKLEYGYKLKDKLYEDEPIQVATRPQPTWRDKLALFLQTWRQRLASKSSQS